MAVEFLRDHELIQLLPDGGFIGLVCLDYAVNAPENIFLKQILDNHVNLIRLVKMLDNNWRF